MYAARLHATGAIESAPLIYEQVDEPMPGRGEVAIEVTACGVCRSNLHMAEGDWMPDSPAFLSIIPGHEVVGRVSRLGEDVTGVALGDRVGVQPLWRTCGRREFCVGGREQLCRSSSVRGITP